MAKEGRMNLAILRCRAQYGTEAPPVTIEVFLSGGAARVYDCGPGGNGSTRE